MNNIKLNKIYYLNLGTENLYSILTHQFKSGGILCQYLDSDSNPYRWDVIPYEIWNYNKY